MSKKKVIIALSGGVDSATAAYLLKEQNYEVIGVFMQNWDDYLGNQPTPICTQSQDWQDAEVVAQHLNISLHKASFLPEYWEKVFTSFLHDLAIGLTPNPDILCNSVIKFRYFAEYVTEKFAPDFIATGHYAKVIQKNNDYYLSQPKDSNKDQTYFLCQINHNILNKLIFPLADLTKQQVRLLAEKIGLTNAQKKDSTGICFIGERKFNIFLASYFPDKKGGIIDFDSKKMLGKHLGTHYFTIGQRRQLGLSGHDRPYYVIGKQTKKNLVYVVKGWNNERLYSQWCTVKNLNWLVNENKLNEVISSTSIMAKFRYRQPEITVQITPNQNYSELKVEFLEKQRAITPGQYAVFYYQNICLGGGIIKETDKVNELGEPIENL